VRAVQGHFALNMRASGRQGNSEHVEDNARLFRHPARVPGRVPDHANIDLSQSWHCRNCVLHHHRQFLRRWAIGRGQRHVDFHRAIVGDVDAVNQTDLVDVGRNFRVVDGLERDYDLVFEPGDLVLRQRGRLSAGAGCALSAGFSTMGVSSLMQKTPAPS
jgi:hypothetical protein